ncbi:auxin-responsive protein SAUR67-like [Tripterygium wilfordii]|uniref:auxin-responsive protein SAUR67-like n=1 Tax=Tripterygium wilfordii TaxID=458696 RepID=UPI0018F851C0|nr:auxin-responsive protein SAUR67-like [Tripterygium wilfordii]
MISTQKLIRLARRWQKFVAIKRKRVTFLTTDGGLDVESYNTSATRKGHFVVYTTDQRRFMLPLKFLNHEVVRELFELAEEEFGLPSDGHLTLPCDANFMEYVILLIQNHITKDIQKALLMSISNNRCSLASYLHQEEKCQEPMVCIF